MVYLSHYPGFKNRKEKREHYLILAHINLGRDSLLIDLPAVEGYVLIGPIFHAVCRIEHRHRKLAAPEDKPVKIDRLIVCCAMLKGLLEA